MHFFRKMSSLKTLWLYIPSYAIIIDSVITSVVGCALFFAPREVGNFVLQRETDGVHWHLIRCVGGQLIASAFVFYRFSKRQMETMTTCFIMRVISAILIIFLFVHARSVNPTLLEQNVSYYVIYGGFISIGVSVFLLLTTGWKVGSELQEGKIGQILYQLDSIASVTIGMAWIAHPSWLLHRQVKISMDESHEFCGRLMGVLFIASQIISIHALHWKDRKNRSLAAEARALCCLFILFAQIWSQVAYGNHWSGAHWVGISLFSTWTVIAVIYRICMSLSDRKSVKKKTK